MLAGRAGTRLLARLEAALCPAVGPSCSFSAAAAEAAPAQDQGRWANKAAVLHGVKVRCGCASGSVQQCMCADADTLQDIRFESHPLPQELAPDHVRIRWPPGRGVHVYTAALRRMCLT